MKQPHPPNAPRNEIYHSAILYDALFGCCLCAGTGTLKLFFPDVEEKPRAVHVPAPAMARAVRPGVLIALPAVPFQEQSLFERKVARLRQLEAFMVEFPLPLDVYDACDIMDVTIADEYEALRETDYNSYSMLAIKAAEKRFRAEALRNF